MAEENENDSNEPKRYQIMHAPHTVFEIEPGESLNMPILDAFELTHAAPHSVCRKAFATVNINSISVTRDTSQLDTSWLKDLA